MSRKHFNDLAANLYAVKPVREDDGHFYNDDKLDGWKAAVEAVIQVCLAHNVRFNSDKFRKAAGLTIS